MFIARVMQNFSHGSTHWCCILIFVMVLSVIWLFIVMIITLSSQLESRVPGLWQYTLFFLINTQNFEITAKLFNKLTKIVPQNFSSLIWSIFWEYYFTQTNNYKRYKRLKLYYIFTILKTLSTFLCYKFCQIPMSLNFNPFVHTTRYFLKCLTKRSCNFLTKEVNLHTCSYIKRVFTIVIFYFNLICYVILFYWSFTPVHCIVIDIVNTLLLFKHWSSNTAHWRACLSHHLPNFLMPFFLGQNSSASASVVYFWVGTLIYDKSNGYRCFIACSRYDFPAL